MYRIAVPVMLTSPTYDREAILRDLRRAGATRVFLAIPPFVPDEEKQNSIFECLSREISGFRENGVEVGVWFWTFWVDADMGFTRMTGVTGKESPTECCPLDGKFLDFALRNIARIASMHPDLIQFDDDFRFGMQNCGRGCVCRLHRKKIAELVGKELPAGDVSEILLGGKPNAFRSAFIRANGDSLRGFAKAVRETVDKVDPAIRVGQCACIGTYDLDGTDSFEISRILAGKTAPFLRLIGAPYWAAEKQWGNRLQDVIELERIQRSWGGEGIEIFAEGDAYPRPRFHTPASYVELFDAALRADGSLDGILKYMADYTSSASYETGYFDRHVADENEKQALYTAGKDLSAVGVRVYVPMKTAEESDFTGCPVDRPDERFFPRAPRTLACAAIPTVYHGTGVAGIAFGEAARHLPKEAFTRPLILDARAAKILAEQGKDVGVTVCSGIEKPNTLRFPAYKETVAVADPMGGAITVPKENARVLATYLSDGGEYPYCVSFVNADGEKYLIFGFDTEFACEDLWRNYAYPRVIRDALASFGAELPAVCSGNPDLYMICKEANGKRLVGLFNCFADSIRGAKVELGYRPSTVDFRRTAGHVCDGGVILDRIPAFGYVWFICE